MLTTGRPYIEMACGSGNISININRNSHTPFLYHPALEEPAKLFRSGSWLSSAVKAICREPVGDANASTTPAESVLLASLSWAASPYSAMPMTSLTGCPGSWQQKWLNLPDLEKTRIDLEIGDRETIRFATKMAQN